MMRGWGDLDELKSMALLWIFHFFGWVDGKMLKHV